MKTATIAVCLAALGAVFAASGFAATAPVRGDGEVPLTPQTDPPDAPPTAPVDRTGAIPIVVALGDSFASGEGGQFAGMIYNNGLVGEVASGRMATHAPQVNAGKQVFRRDSFGQPMPSGRISRCHRSDTAPVNWIRSRGTQKYFNLACSGSTTTDIYTPQMDVIPADLAGTDDLAARVRLLSPMDRLRLLASAQTPDGPRYSIHTITVSIGGNDIGFGPILADCIDVASHNSCGDTSRNPGRSVNRRLHAGIERARPLITKVLDDITTLMRDNGYTDDQWNLVYVGGPNLFAPSTNRHKVRRGFSSRWQSPGVPMTDNTVDWSRETALPLVQKAFRLAARQAIGPVTFLNLGPAFDGHELSSGSTSLIWCRRPNISSRAARCVNSATPQAGSAEWVVPIDSDFVVSRLRQLLGGGGSRLDQSFHPNRFGQEAIGRCIDRTISGIDFTRTVYEGMTCRGGAGLRPSQVRVSPGG